MFFKKLYDDTILFCKKKSSTSVLYFISFIESIIFPLPTDIFLAPFVMARKEYLRLVIFTTFFSVLGGILAYLIGIFFWDFLSIHVEQYFPNISEKIENFDSQYKELGFLIVLMGGFSPFPYKITCIASGILNINFFFFVLASILSRGLRFFLVGYLFYKFNEKAKEFLEKYINFLSLIVLFIIILILVNKYLS